MADQEDAAEAAVDSVEDVVVGVAEDADSSLRTVEDCWEIPGDFSDVRKHVRLQMAQLRDWFWVTDPCFQLGMRYYGVNG